MGSDLAHEFERVIIHAAKHSWCAAIGSCTTCGGSMFRTAVYLLEDLPQDLDALRIWGPSQWAKKPPLPEAVVQAALDSNFAFIDHSFEIYCRDNFDLPFSYRDNWRGYIDVFASLPFDSDTRTALKLEFQKKYDELESALDRMDRLLERVNIYE